MTPDIAPTPETLVDEILGEVDRMPVRRMEAVLERGEAAVEPLAEGLRRALEDDERLVPLWPTVLLGEVGSPGAVPPLMEALRRAEPGEVSLPQAAAEALAKIGGPARPALASLVETGEARERLWAYAALGWIEDEAAYELLVEALTADPEMADVVASALADRGREETIPLIYGALREAEPWQRVDLEEAIQMLHAGAGQGPELERDWRLRYRMDPSLGVVAPTRAAVTAIVRAHERLRDRAPRPLRPLEEILAEPWDVGGPEPCESCGEPRFRATGVPVCPETAVSVAVIQHRLLGEYRQEEGTDDLFEVLDEVELETRHLRHAPEPRSRKARERREDRLAALEMLHGACTWLIERGIEDVGGGRAVLLAEASALRERYGDPDGVFRRPGGVRGTVERPDRPRVAPDEPGRNDPCPCGSGRKYKKCCGSPV